MVARSVHARLTSRHSVLLGRDSQRLTSVLQHSIGTLTTTARTATGSPTAVMDKPSDTSDRTNSLTTLATFRDTNRTWIV